MGGYNDESEDDLQEALARQRAWVSDEELAGLSLERATGLKSTGGGVESPIDQAMRMLRENSPMAAASLIKLAQNSPSDTVRLRASVEILNRAANNGGAADGGNPWDDVYEHAFKEVSDYVKAHPDMLGNNER